MQPSAPSTELDESLNRRFLDAAQKGNAEVVKTLIKAGANVDWTNSNGESALHYAAHNGHDKVVDSLIKAKADVNLIDKNRKSALMIATENGHDKVVDSLLNAVVDVNYTNPWGDNALILAIKKGLDKFLNPLIVAGADVNFVINKRFYAGKTPIEQVALNPNINENEKKEFFSKLYEMGAILREDFFNDADISDNMKDFAKKHNTTEKIKERDENLLKNTNLQDTFKESILAGKPITFRDNVVDKVLLKALRSITEKDLEEAVSIENLYKLKESGAYALLKISKHLSEDEFSLAARNLDAVKAIPDIVQKTFTNPSTVSSNLAEDMVSKILMYSLDPKEPPYGLGEKLTLKIIGILTAPAARSNPSIVRPDNSDSTSAQPLDPQQSSAQAPAINHSALFGESLTKKTVVTADLVFVSGEVANTPTNKPLAQPSNPHQLSAQASTNSSSTPNFQSLINPGVTAQLVLAPVAVAQENPSSITVVRPGFVRSEIARLESLKNGPLGK